MSFSFYFFLFVSGFITLLIGYIVVRTFLKKEIPDNPYTPFDYITGQSDVEFRDEKEEIEQDNDEDGDKN
ncbi:DUF3951 domain-containing protein [Chengkuizengella sp. SCS-71B]|uniref:DUF3951 domain-containing protein n=1 Tax=Chengkuizengella sp. SCS-71B TaxID=3115290 RepID=UPI0032C22C23